MIITVDGEDKTIGLYGDYSSSMDFLLKRLDYWQGNLNKLCDEMETQPDDFVEALHDYPDEEPEEMIMEAYDGRYPGDDQREADDRLYSEYSDK